MHAKEKHLHRLYGKEEIARDGASIYCFIIFWKFGKDQLTLVWRVRVPQLPL